MPGSAYDDGAWAYDAAYGGNARGRPPLDVAATLEDRPLVWHELTLQRR